MDNIKDPQTMGRLLDDYGDSGLRKIVRQAQRLLAMDHILKSCLPENLRPHCQVAQATATELTLGVASAAWLTHLRYLKPQLLQQLQKHPQCAYVRDVQFKIQPAASLAEKKPVPPPPAYISAENKELLHSIAETVSHPLLKKSLLKLSR